jgi:hypothetical protein
MSILEKIKTTAAAMASIGQAVSAARLAVPLAPGATPLLALVPTISACGVKPISPGVSARACERADDWRIALPPAPAEELDAQFLAAAWELGAWDVARTERAPLPQKANKFDPWHGIAHLLHAPYRITFDGKDGDPMPCPVDPTDWASQAAQHGWLVWLCKPMRYGPSIRAGWITKDRTLRPDGGRDQRAAPWRPWMPVVVGSDHQTVIRLGRAPHGNR